jgi:hypothetical protein
MFGSDINYFIANSAVFRWWHLSGVLSEPCLHPPSRPAKVVFTLRKPNQIYSTGRLADRAAAGYILASTSYFYFNFNIPLKEREK